MEGGRWRSVSALAKRTFAECHDADVGFEEVDVEFEEDIALF